MFTDKHVREALTSLAREPPSKLIETLEKELAQPVSAQRLDAERWTTNVRRFPTFEDLGSPYGA